MVECLYAAKCTLLRTGDDLPVLTVAKCPPFTHTVVTPTVMASTFTFSKVNNILREDGLIGLNFWLVIGINHHKLMTRVTTLKHKLLAVN